MDKSVPNDWSVEIVTNGPYGQILYHEGSDGTSFFWQFGGGDIVAIVHIDPAQGWNEKYPWAAGRRREVLERMIEEVIRKKAPTCTADVDETSGVICLRERKQTD